MTDDSASRYFEIYRVNLNGEKKKQHWMVPWFQSTMLLACHCFTDCYILGRIKQIYPVSEGYLRKIPILRTGKISLVAKWLGKFASPLNRYFWQITLTNRIYLYNNLSCYISLLPCCIQFCGLKTYPQIKCTLKI